MLVLSLCYNVPEVRAQYVGNGDLVMTCFSGTNYGPNLNGPVVAVYHVQNAEQQTKGVNWLAPNHHGPSNAQWTRSRLGEVFGVALDDNGNIYVTATTVYGDFLDGTTNRNVTASGFHPGNIYQLDNISGAVKLFASLPNTGPGLGNICYSSTHDKLYVTNFEDGKIYVLDMAGNYVTYDPSSFDEVNKSQMVLDDGTPGFAPLGERLWGIGFNEIENRLYYSVWIEDAGQLQAGRYSSTTFNTIRSVELDANGIPVSSTDQSEVQMEDWASNSSTKREWSSPVSDIAFTQDGTKMLLAERTMQYDFLYLDFSKSPQVGWGSWAHSSRVIEYRGGSSSWSPSVNQFNVGLTSKSNSAGGVDYGYRDVVDNTLRDCDSTVWATADNLLQSPVWLYGLQQMPYTGGYSGNSVLIDADEDLVSHDKTLIGDVEVFKFCEVPNPCDSVAVTARTQVFGTAPNRVCSTAITLTNNYQANFFSSVTLEISSSNSAFIASSIAGPPGWGVQQTSATSATWAPNLGAIPLGVTTGMSFILHSTVSPPQELIVTWHGRNGVECVDTIQTTCPPADTEFPPSCLEVLRQEISCVEKGEETSTFEIEFEIRNLYNYLLPAHHLIVWPTVNGQITVSPTEFEFPSGIQFGGDSEPLKLSFTAPHSLVGEEVCIAMQLHGQKQSNGYFLWCCLPDTICLTVPECKDCCDGIETGIATTSLQQQGNGGAIIKSDLSIGPNPIVSASARIVSIERSPVYSGNNTLWIGGSTSGRIVAGSITPSLPLQYGLNPPTSEIGWGLKPAGVDMSSGSISLTLDFPKDRIGWCQWDTLTIQVRYTFTDSNWVTCDTTVRYVMRREGRLEYKRIPDDQIFDSTGRALIVQPWLPDSVVRPVRLTMINPQDGDIIIYSPTWAQRYRFTELKLQPGVAVTIDSLGDPTTGARGVIRDRAAIIPLTAELGESTRLRALFNNPHNVDVLTVAATLKYIDVNSPRDTMITLPITVYGLVPGSGKDDSLLTEQTIVDRVQTYRLQFVNTNRMARPISHVQISVDDNARILAVGPPRGDSNSTDVVLSVTREVAGAVTLQQWPASEAYIASVEPDNRIDPVYLTLRNDSDDSTTIRYRTFDEDGVLLSEGATVLMTSTSGIEEDIPTTGSSVQLFPIAPDPGVGMRSVQVSVARVERDVVLSVYDLQGNEVMRILDREQLSRGMHMYFFDSSQLPSGTYYLMLLTATERHSQPMRVVE